MLMNLLRLFPEPKNSEVINKIWQFESDHLDLEEALLAQLLITDWDLLILTWTDMVTAQLIYSIKASNIKMLYATAKKSQLQQI